ncbi:MAG: metal-dependent hydrolase [Thermoplasmata archaeon]|nr:metal-dependent hydrolase [Thermoplasmata archaeon]
MDPIVHGMLAALFSMAIVKKVNDRRLVVIAGVIPDIDGFFILFSEKLFYTYHHTFGHSYLFGIPIALTAGYFAEDKKKVILGSLGAFTIHLIADIFGSNWPIPPLYPLSHYSLTSTQYLSHHIIYDVINPVVTVAALIAILIIMYYKGLSPVEFISEKIDRRLVGLYIYPLKYRCEICGKRAFIECAECKRKVCSEHIGRFFKWRCSGCERTKE